MGLWGGSRAGGRQRGWLEPVSISMAPSADGRDVGGQPGKRQAQIWGGTVRYPVCVPVSQLPGFELVRVKLWQAREQQCCGSQAARQREVGCPGTSQELLLPG